jgi:CheY-like chemotaxis protein
MRSRRYCTIKRIFLPPRQPNPVFKMKYLAILGPNTGFPVFGRIAFPVKLVCSLESDMPDVQNVQNMTGNLAQKQGPLMMTRILLVDDHPIMREGLRTVLQRRSGWEVVGEASNGVEALEKAATLSPDVIVLDITMPEMNGLDVCRQVKQKMPDLEVLFVTQHDSPQMMQEAMRAGAKGYVVKSNAARDLLDAVELVSQHQVFTSPGKGH